VKESNNANMAESIYVDEEANDSQVFTCDCKKQLKTKEEVETHSFECVEMQS
jgi:hypothetical protein